MPDPGPTSKSLSIIEIIIFLNFLKSFLFCFGSESSGDLINFTKSFFTAPFKMVKPGPG